MDFDEPNVVDDDEMEDDGFDICTGDVDFELSYFGVRFSGTGQVPDVHVQHTDDGRWSVSVGGVDAARAASRWMERNMPDVPDGATRIDPADARAGDRILFNWDGVQGSMTIERIDRYGWACVRERDEDGEYETRMFNVGREWMSWILPQHPLVVVRDDADREDGKEVNR